MYLKLSHTDQPTNSLQGGFEILMIIILSLFSFVALSLQLASNQKCTEKSFYPSGPIDISETLNFAKEFKSSSENFVKESLFKSIKESIGKMENLPKSIENKLKDDKFIMESIEKVIEEQAKPEKQPEASIPTKFAPYGGEAHIKNWEELYHYYPHLVTKLRLWKLQFKETARRNAKKFNGCANPADLVDWLVPDIEDIKKNKSKRY